MLFEIGKFIVEFEFQNLMYIAILICIIYMFDL